MFHVPFDNARPVETPDGLKDPAGAVKLLAATVAKCNSNLAAWMNPGARWLASVPMDGIILPMVAMVITGSSA